MEGLQVDLDEYWKYYNTQRTHQGKRSQGRMPMATFQEGKKLFAEKNFSEITHAPLEAWHPRMDEIVNYIDWLALFSPLDP